MIKKSLSLTFLTCFLLVTIVFVMDRVATAEAKDPGRQEAEPIPVVEPLRVVTKKIEPFVIKEEERLTGFSIDLWEEIALVTGLPFAFVEVETVRNQIKAVETENADVGIAAIGMTPEREERIDFSYPYFRSGLQILTPEQPSSSLLLFLSAFVNSRLAIVIGTYQEIYDKWFATEEG